MGDILFWIFIVTTILGVGAIGYFLYKEMFDPYDGYETYLDYYKAQIEGDTNRRK